MVKLLKDPRGKVSASASSVLRGLSAQPRQREQVNSQNQPGVEGHVIGSPLTSCLTPPGFGGLFGAAGARQRGHQGVRVQGASLPQGTFASPVSPACGQSRRIHTCLSSGIIQAKESIDQLVYVCRTDKEDVREAAKQALLVLGELFNSKFPLPVLSPVSCRPL